MSNRQQSDRGRWRAIFGLLLCSLMFIFAIGAKVAPYHREQRSLASTKAFQSNEAAAIDCAPALQAAMQLSVAIVIGFAPEPPAHYPPMFEQVSVTNSAWFTPPAATNPPPTV